MNDMHTFTVTVRKRSGLGSFGEGDEVEEIVNLALIASPQLEVVEVLWVGTAEISIIRES